MSALAELEFEATTKPPIWSSINMKLLYWVILVAALPMLLIGVACIYLTRQAVGALAGGGSAFSQILVIDIVGLALSVIFIAAAAWLAGRSLSRPVIETADVVQRIGSGDLSEPNCKTMLTFLSSSQLFKRVLSTPQDIPNSESTSRLSIAALTYTLKRGDIDLLKVAVR